MRKNYETFGGGIITSQNNYPMIFLCVIIVLRCHNIIHCISNHHCFATIINFVYFICTQSSYINKFKCISFTTFAFLTTRTNHNNKLGDTRAIATQDKPTLDKVRSKPQLSWINHLVQDQVQAIAIQDILPPLQGLG